MFKSLWLSQLIIFLPVLHWSITFSWFLALPPLFLPWGADSSGLDSAEIILTLVPLWWILASFSGWCDQSCWFLLFCPTLVLDVCVMLRCCLSCPWPTSRLTIWLTWFDTADCFTLFFRLYTFLKGCSVVCLFSYSCLGLFYTSPFKSLTSM